MSMSLWHQALAFALMAACMSAVAVYAYELGARDGAVKCQPTTARRR